ncbi:MAG: hypothetical protein O7C59_08950, partial [Rickettsia endosymbiont of Ixodes persulcatus]|nr:hypothetical protein [Rickettsia endosymbiont of Ixodes persulcatus]
FQFFFSFFAVNSRIINHVIYLNQELNPSPSFGCLGKFWGEKIEPNFHAVIVSKKRRKELENKQRPAQSELFSNPVWPFPKQGKSYDFFLFLKSGNISSRN